MDQAVASLTKINVRVTTAALPPPSQSTADTRPNPTMSARLRRATSRPRSQTQVAGFAAGRGQRRVGFRQYGLARDDYLTGSSLDSTPLTAPRQAEAMTLEVSLQDRLADDYARRIHAVVGPTPHLRVMPSSLDVLPKIGAPATRERCKAPDTRSWASSRVSLAPSRRSCTAWDRKRSGSSKPHSKNTVSNLA